MTRLDEILAILSANGVKHNEAEAIRIAVLTGYWQSTDKPTPISDAIADQCGWLAYHAIEEDIEP